LQDAFEVKVVAPFNETTEELLNGMKYQKLAIAAGFLALGTAAWLTPGHAQGPLYDRVNVNLPYTVSIGDKTLQPGEYVIQQLRDSGGGSRVLLIYSDNGMKFETSAMTIPALDINTARDTKVVLHHFGSDYYFDKVWIQGKDYGYEFPLPDSVKSREREKMEAVAVAATYQATPAVAESTTTETTTTAATTQQTTTSAAVQQQTVVEQPVQQATERPRTVAQATEPVPATTAPQTVPPSNADRSGPEMPATSAGWLTMLIAGGALSGLGLKLRRG
jgi:hypothetical protein